MLDRSASKLSQTKNRPLETSFSGNGFPACFIFVMQSLDNMLMASLDRSIIAGALKRFGRPLFPAATAATIALLFLALLISFRYGVPVDNMPKGFYIIWTTILIL